MNTILEQLKCAEQEGKQVFKLKLNPSIRAIDIFKQLKSNNYEPNLVEENNDLYIEVKLLKNKSNVIDMSEFKSSLSLSKKSKVLSVEDNVIRVSFGKNG